MAASSSHVPDKTESAIDPPRSRPGPGPQHRGGGSGAARGSASDGSSSQDSLTARAPDAHVANFVNPVRILSYAPSHGAPGTLVDVRVQLSALERQEWHLNCLVGLDGFDLWSEAFALPAQGPGVLLIRAVIPDVVGHATTQPLSLRIYDNSGQTLCTIPFGMFAVTPEQSTAQALSSRRDFQRAGQAAPTSPHLTSSEPPPPPPQPLHQWQGAAAEGVAHTQTAADLMDASAESAFASASQRFPQGFPLASQTLSQTQVAPQSSFWQSPRRSGAPTQRPVLLAPRFDVASNRQPRPEPVTQAGSAPQPPSPSFNPYSIYPNRAILNIQGDLDAVARSWTAQELRIGRRIVAFRRRQSGRTITISFAVVPEGYQDADSFSVSCIWWADKEQAFITSVDTIHLLQSIMNIRFTVEEKNRIRRNLEGFQPLTVAKAKPGSESFFSLVMGLPEPKPRNIEKDVKIFDWSKLEPALMKIVSKYSASPSSTAGLLNPAASSSKDGGI